MALSNTQTLATAAYWANQAFSATVTANFSLTDIQAAAAAIDNAFDTTLNAAVAAVGGTTTVINGLAAVIPAPFSTATAQQKTLLACHVLMKRAGII
jgi:hypothetical protein